MLAVDRGQRLAQLGHLLGRTGIQGVLHHRLVGTGLAAKGGLQDRVRAQAGVDLAKAMHAGQDRDESVKQFVERRILHRLLGNLHAVADRAKQIDLLEMHPKGGQAGGGRKVPRHLGTAKLCHGDEPPLVRLGVTPKCRFITARCPSPASKAPVIGAKFRQYYGVVLISEGNRFVLYVIVVGIASAF